jgi:hypothetical protein
MEEVATMRLPAVGRQAALGECVKARKFSAWRRASRILVVLGFAAALGGCEPVQSLYPFFDPKDVVIGSDLAGTWKGRFGDTDSTLLRFHGERDETDGYQVEVVIRDDRQEKDGDEPEETTITFSVHLFRVGDSLFADFYPVNYGWPFFASMHTAYQVKVDGSHLQLAWLDDEKVKRFIEENHLSLTSYGTAFLILTGKTEELKTSLLLQAEREDLLDDDREFTRQ